MRQWEEGGRTLEHWISSWALLCWRILVEKERKKDIHDTVNIHNKELRFK